MTKTNKISLLLTIIFALLLTFFCKGLFRSQYISVAINITSSSPATHRLYWSPDDKDFNPGNSKTFKTQLKDSQELIKIKVPASKVHKIQINLDAGKLDSAYTISSIKLNKAEHLKDVETYDLEKNGNQLLVKGTNPYLSISLPDESPVKAKTHYDWLPMTGLFLIFSIILYSLFSKLLIPLYLTTPRKGEVLFLCLIAIILTLPLLKTHVRETKSVEENRNLASPPIFQMYSAPNLANSSKPGSMTVLEAGNISFAFMTK